ncbi:cell wall hydrolase [Paenibacillus sp. MMS20-IR301]|uniref:cell wall hydrolase n=1 Tax=Paenibacillus sp. MMS20-IR301 TaxID=2895946 RepID=UPI0028E89D25|nr:cell wall hydrolase [Paenibacillus sp. MMS20-IR301]WNS41249.1 cell wall hydrolase [Paenibacillus sp. MMS20-IR301]
MVIYKQSRCIALLVGVILVSFSAISLMSPEGAATGENVIEMDKLKSASQKYAEPFLPEAGSALHRTSASSRTITPMLYTTATAPVHTWASMANAGWLSPEKLQRPEPAQKAEAVQPKVAVVKASPSAAQALKKAATGTASIKTSKQATQQHPPAKLFFSRTKLLSQEQQTEATWSYAVSEEDLLLLQKIVMAEAEGEPYQGKVAVANVVLNRLRSANFPDTIHDVIYQKSQFSPVANGRLKRVKPNADSIKAVNAALTGVKEVSDDTYFFLSLKLAQDLTVHHSRKLAKTIGNHTFYK